MLVCPLVSLFRSSVPHTCTWYHSTFNVGDNNTSWSLCHCWWILNICVCLSLLFCVCLCMSDCMCLSIFFHRTSSPTFLRTSQFLPGVSSTILKGISPVKASHIGKSLSGSGEAYLCSPVILSSSLLTNKDSTKSFTPAHNSPTYKNRLHSNHCSDSSSWISLSSFAHNSVTACPIFMPFGLQFSIFFALSSFYTIWAFRMPSGHEKWMPFGPPISCQPGLSLLFSSKMPLGTDCALHHARCPFLFSWLVPQNLWLSMPCQRVCQVDKFHLVKTFDKFFNHPLSFCL